MRSKSLLLHGLCGLGWGIFFSISPIGEVLILGAIVWIPLLILCEVRLSRRLGFLPGFAVRWCAILMIFTMAWLAPVKFRHEMTFKELPASETTLGALAEKSPCRLKFAPEHADRKVILPSRRPTLAEVMDAVQAQTGLSAVQGNCGNAMTVLWGGYPMFVDLQ